MSILLYGCTTCVLNETLGEKARWELHKDVACYFELFLRVVPNKTTVVRPLNSYLANHPSKMNKTLPVKVGFS